MPTERQHRERIIAWQAKLGGVIHDALPDDVGKAKPEIDALYVALLELGIGALLDQMGQTETMTFINCVMYDMFDAQDNPTHWRHREAAQLAARYKKARQDIHQQRR